MSGFLLGAVAAASVWKTSGAAARAAGKLENMDELGREATPPLPTTDDAPESGTATVPKTYGESRRVPSGMAATAHPENDGANAPLEWGLGEGGSVPEQASGLPATARLTPPQHPQRLNEEAAGPAEEAPAGGSRTPGRFVVLAFGFLVAAGAVGTGWMNFQSESRPSGRLASNHASPQAGVVPCPLQTALLARGDRDGRFPVQDDVSTLIAADIATFSVMGQEFAASGQPKDAEAAFLMACRVADQLKGADSTASADAKFQLGAHYLKLALANEALAQAVNMPELRKRTEDLLADSQRVYAAAYGGSNEKTRMAANQLAELRQIAMVAQAETQDTATASAGPSGIRQPAQDLASRGLQQAGQAAGADQPSLLPALAPPSQPLSPSRPSPLTAPGGAPSAVRAPGTAATVASIAPASVRDAVPATAVAPPDAPSPAPRVLPTGPSPTQQPPLPAQASLGPASPRPAMATRVRPSFDCDKGRSMLEKMICSDAELATKDRELGRLYARARSMSNDAAAFRRQQESEWVRRESTCRDRNCLLRWYAQRRAQLVNVIERRGQLQSELSGQRALPGELDGIYKGR
ncbi:MAG: hypothetical protein JWP47_1587 [Polaromonas sp.]|nr:hypothetical protein [Polaromonas sp.]